MRRFALFTALLSVASSASAQRSGLLLGLSSDSGYRTLWIAPVAGRVAVAAEQPGLIVPHDDGFHRVQIVRWCSTTLGNEFTEKTMFVNQSDVMVDRLTDSVAVAKPDSGEMPCATADSIVTAYNDSVAKADSIARSRARTAADSDAARHDDTAGDVCRFDFTHVTYVTAGYTSLYSESGSTEYCSPASYTSSGHRVVLESGGGSVELMPLLTRSQSKGLEAEWQRQKGDCALEAAPGDSWGIVRALGGWKLAFATSGANACRGRSGNEEAGFDISVPAPAALARRESTTWLAAAKRVIPKLDDVVTSPANDLVIVRAGDQLSVFVPVAGRLGAVTATVALRPQEEVVMTEWATGAHVDRWTRTLTALHTLP